MLSERISAEIHNSSLRKEVSSIRTDLDVIHSALQSELSLLKAHIFCRVQEEEERNFSYLDLSECFRENKLTSQIRGIQFITHLQVPANVEVIHEKCFYNCSALSCVTFAAGSCLKRIEGSAFYGCTRLSEIEIPANVEILCSSSFSDCS